MLVSRLAKQKNWQGSFFPFIWHWVHHWLRKCADWKSANVVFGWKENLHGKGIRTTDNHSDYNEVQYCFLLINQRAGELSLTERVTMISKSTSWNETINATSLPPTSLDVKRDLTARGCYERERFILNHDGLNLLYTNSNVATYKAFRFILFQSQHISRLGLTDVCLGCVRPHVFHPQTHNVAYLWAGAYNTAGLHVA